MHSYFPTTRKAYLCAAAALLAVSIAACLVLSRQWAAPLRLGEYHSYSCNTGATESGKTFNILVVTSMLAKQIADRLCHSAVMARHYGAVRISWKPRKLLNAEQLLGEEYDLIWSREHSMRGLLPEFSDYYDTLLRYDHYQVYWFSREPIAALSREYFLGKRIGLLNDRLSHTHYLLPLESLKRAGVDLSREKPVYFDDALAMYRAFARSELDLISGGDWLQRDLDLPLYKLLIADDATAATLFIRSLHNRRIRCEVSDSLQALHSLLAETQVSVNREHACDPPA